MSSSLNVRKKNTPLRFIFSTLFSVFYLVMRHGVSCLIYYMRLLSYFYASSVWALQIRCFQPIIFLCDLDYLQEILFSLETIIIRLSRWYHRTWLCLIFSTHFSVSGLPRQKWLQGRLLSIWTSHESLLVSWPHLTTCTTVCWESKSSLAL